MFDKIKAALRQQKYEASPKGRLYIKRWHARKRLVIIGLKNRKQKVLC